MKQARALVMSSDLIAYENLQVRNMVRNHHLAKSISDAAWSVFIDWVKYYAQIFGKVQQPVPPQNTTIDCFDCKQPVQKSLSTRTHVCPHCGSVRCKDENAAWNILEKGLRLVGINTVGHTEIKQLVWTSRLGEGGTPRCMRSISVGRMSVFR
ncbi:MAG: transposase [Cyanobacteria bacterium RM1_2_2]|nr:transposase [Cyanobacteria bacterium RM1_2_2]